ncbi:hypothetical protein D3C78_796560 [compost metagenome]
MHLQQLPQRHVQRLLAHAKQGQQFLDAQVRIAGDEKHDALMHPAQAAAFEHFIGLGGESLVAEEKRFHGLLLGKRVFKVKHVDVSIRRSVISVNKFDSFSSCLATGDPHGFFRTCLTP